MMKTKRQIMSEIKSLLWENHYQANFKDKKRIFNIYQNKSLVKNKFLLSMFK